MTYTDFSQLELTEMDLESDYQGQKSCKLTDKSQI